MDKDEKLHTQIKNNLHSIRRQIAELESLDLRNQRSQELFLALFISSPIGIFIVQNGKFIDVNPQFENLIGYSKAELMGIKSLDLVLPEDRENVKNNAIKMLKGKRTQPYEYRAMQKDGSLRWIMETVTSIQYLGKSATLGNFMDINERKLTEEALLESQQHFWDLFENANDLIYIHDLKGDFVSVNKRAIELTGYSREEAHHLNFTQLVAEEYIDLASKTIVRDIFKGHSLSYELDLITKNGQRVPMELRPRLLYKNGKPYGVQGIARDITERRQMENQLRATNQRLQDIIEFLPDATFVIDQDRKVIAWNRAIEEMTGVHKQDIIGQGDYAYSVPFYGIRRPMLIDLINNLEAEHEHYKEIRREGASLYAEMFTPAVYGGRGAYIWSKPHPFLTLMGT
ncbi:PAS domain-containing protein [Syntrophomonas palmitatica]|uniref:PAS domain-containing protein n=1 Tax=Syntrophomonas palmitatica TaxID=402877 RepID=UPI0006CFA338|nr:PAS domain S-box protein [Syntrophomonas palmitatica]